MEMCLVPEEDGLPISFIIKRLEINSKNSFPMKKFFQVGQIFKRELFNMVKPEFFKCCEPYGATCEYFFLAEFSVEAAKTEIDGHFLLLFTVKESFQFIYLF